MSQLSASDDIVMVEQPVAEKPAKAKPTKKRATKKVESEEEDYADSESDEPVKKKKARTGGATERRSSERQIRLF